MANTKSAKKQILVNRRNRTRNFSYRTRMKNAIKRTKAAILDPEIPDEQAKKAVQDAQSVLYSTASRGVIHRNTASRRFSRLVLLYRKARVLHTLKPEDAVLSSNELFEAGETPVQSGQTEPLENQETPASSE